jgi:predicted metal-dependent hydrolase
LQPKPSTNYLAGYPPELVAPVRKLITEERLAAVLCQHYPSAHAVKTDSALYDYVHELKNEHLGNVGQLSKVSFDSKLHVIRNALGTHTTISRVQGKNLKAKREIRVASIFKAMPLAFLRMIVVHELAHMKVQAHDKAFYQLCRHMAADYFQLEFDLRAYLSYLDAGGQPLWQSVAPQECLLRGTVNAEK